MRKIIDLRNIHDALIMLGHEKLWFCYPRPHNRKKGVCQIVTWNNYIVAERHLDVHTKGWDFTKHTTVIFPYPPGSQPSQFDDELTEESIFTLGLIY